MVKQLVEMKRTFAVLVLAFLVTMATIDKTDYHSAIVFEKLGTILHNQGVVAMNTDDMLISVFVKVPLPKVHVHTSCMHFMLPIKRAPGTNDASIVTKQHTVNTVFQNNIGLI